MREEVCLPVVQEQEQLTLGYRCRGVAVEHHEPTVLSADGQQSTVVLG